ncbi:hypothetical protein T12_5455 [Trichinella patagoniensis]|uniref:Uncharacterized protein n=1 Tax=Trichinella patagoniensis TaxID=990121 RepID=A0A0V0ZDR6_9BILA|nr:hypothetical protein T12_5455 [Trichinella patagoniensis]
MLNCSLSSKVQNCEEMNWVRNGRWRGGSMRFNNSAVKRFSRGYQPNFSHSRPESVELFGGPVLLRRRNATLHQFVQRNKDQSDLLHSESIRANSEMNQFTPGTEQHSIFIENKDNSNEREIVFRQIGEKDHCKPVMKKRKASTTVAHSGCDFKFIQMDDFLHSEGVGESGGFFNSRSPAHDSASSSSFHSDITQSTSNSAKSKRMRCLENFDQENKTKQNAVDENNMYPFAKPEISRLLVKYEFQKMRNVPPTTAEGGSCKSDMLDMLFQASSLRDALKDINIQNGKLVIKKETISSNVIMDKKTQNSSDCLSAKSSEEKYTSKQLTSRKDVENVLSSEVERPLSSLQSMLCEGRRLNRKKEENYGSIAEIAEILEEFEELVQIPSSNVSSKSATKKRLAEKSDNVCSKADRRKRSSKFYENVEGTSMTNITNRQTGENSDVYLKNFMPTVFEIGCKILKLLSRG